MNALLIPVEGAPRTIDIRESFELADMQAAVHGNIELVVLNSHPNLSIFVNEEGKFTEPTNLTATRWAQPDLFAGDWIAGPMLVLGPVDNAGNTTALSDEAKDELLTQLDT